MRRDCQSPHRHLLRLDLGHVPAHSSRPPTSPSAQSRRRKRFLASRKARESRTRAEARWRVEWGRCGLKCTTRRDRLHYLPVFGSPPTLTPPLTNFPFGFPRKNAAAIEAKAYCRRLCTLRWVRRHRDPTRRSLLASVCAALPKHQQPAKSQRRSSASKVQSSSRAGRSNPPFEIWISTL
jgi:hypothetical protein